MTVAETVFTAQGAIIETLPEFKYLNRILSNNDSDEATVNRNLKGAHTTWGPDRLHSLMRRRKPEDVGSMKSLPVSCIEADFLCGTSEGRY
jgi:hypothetical protein